MTKLVLFAGCDPTSSAGVSARPVTLLRWSHRPGLVGCMLIGLGTSASADIVSELWTLLQHVREQTTGGASVSAARPAGPLIAELRRHTGLTWEQLARLFRVSRRSLHFWASGKAMTARHDEHLQRLLAAVRKIDRGQASANRAVLLTACENGIIPFDLLADGEYDQAVALIGPGPALRARPRKLPAEALAARAPRPPDELVAALQDRAVPASGRLLAAKPVPSPRRT